MLLYELPNIVITILLCIVFLILWITFMILAETVYQRMYRRFAVLFFPVILLNYFFFQLCLKEDYEMKVWTVLVYILAMILFDTVSLYKADRFRKENITVISIKQGLDAMSEGICFYTVDGLPQFVNRSMQDISIELTGGTVNDAVIFWKRLVGGNLNEGCEVMSETDDMVIVRSGTRVCAFSNRAMEAGDELKEMVMVDITSEYETFRELAAKKEALELQQTRLREYSRSVTKATIDRELLDAKVKIHDELGEILLLAKRYINTKDVDRKTVTDLWMRNLKLLGVEKKSEERDEYEEIYRAAADIGMRIEIDGELPEDKISKTVVASALHECLTNTFRHAGGDTVYVSVIGNGQRKSVVFTNNGKPPEDMIIERGGLKSLRNIVEDAGFEMKLETDRGFVLTIVL